MYCNNIILVVTVSGRALLNSIAAVPPRVGGGPFKGDSTTIVFKKEFAYRPIGLLSPSACDFPSVHHHHHHHNSSSNNRNPARQQNTCPLQSPEQPGDAKHPKSTTILRDSKTHERLLFIARGGSVELTCRFWAAPGIEKHSISCSSTSHKCISCQTSSKLELPRSSKWELQKDQQQITKYCTWHAKWD